jgi:opacity protein-like surface antigen
LKDGPFVSYLVGGDVENESVGFGWQVGYEHTPHLSLECAVAWNEDESVKLGERLPGLSDAGAIDLDVLSFALTGRAGLRPDPNIYTYLGAGFGLYVLKADNEQVRMAGAARNASFAEADADEEFGFHLALGAETVLTEHWEVFAEYRHVFFDTGVKVTTIPADGAAVTGREDLSYDHGLLRLGLNYRF